MISKADGKFELIRGNPPQHITFYANSEIVGVLHFGPPMRFEGDVQGAVKVFFDHLVAKNNDRMVQLEKLLTIAACPDGNCDGAGTCCRLAPGYDGEEDLDVYECQFCSERRDLLREVND